MGTQVQDTLTMNVHELEVSPSYNQVVAAWAIFCLTFTGQSELSHNYRILDADTYGGEAWASQPDNLITYRSQLLKETCAVEGNAVERDNEIPGILLKTTQLGGSIFAHLLKEICPGSDFLALLVTRGQRLFPCTKLDTPERHFVCRIQGNAFTLETPFLGGASAAETAQFKGLADCFCFAIKQTVTHWQSAKTLQDIDILSDNEMAQILQRNAEPYISAFEPATATLLTKIQTIASVAGDQLALCSSARRMSYAELDNLSDRLAAEVLQFSGKLGSFLPIVGHKSALAVVAMLAAWKSGAAFALIDPKLPRERRESVLMQLRSEVLLLVDEETIRIANARASTAHEPHTLLSSSDQCPSLSPEVGTLPGCGLSDAAYVIFTSGTTGKPKGVVIEHHSISKSMTSLADASGLSSATRMLQYASYTFDACILEIFSTLIVGGAVFIPSDGERNNLLPAFIREHALNTMLLTPSVLQMLDPAECPTIETVFTGGEKMSAMAIEKWSSRVRLMNAYGPTETAVLCSLLDRVTSLTSPENLGWALGSSLWIVDVEDPSRLVPIGAVGELVVCGLTLARGYLDDPKRTTVAFLNNPAWAPDLGPDNRASQRAYRTGDLVRYNADGSIHIVGRKDQQIKLRGQRIELTEIELTVRSLLPHGVEVAVEIARPGGPNSTSQLVLFIVTGLEDDYGVNAGPSILTSKNVARQFGLLTRDLPQQLAGLLPGYMIPSICIPISALPLTRSAKLDRRTLQSWVETLSVADLASMASNSVAGGPEPVGRLEVGLQKLWSQVLSTSPDHISRNAHFFRLGGDSIKAMQLVAMGRNAGIATTVENIFQYPVLWELAEHVDPLNDGGDGQPFDPPPFSLLETSDSLSQMASNVEKLKIDASVQCDVAAELVEDIYPCTPLQEGMLALSLKDPAAYIAHFTFETPTVEVERLQQAWQQAMRRTSVLRTRFISGQSGGFLQVLLRDDPDAITVVDHLKPPSKGFHVALGRRTNQIHLCPIDNGSRVSIVWSSHHATYDAVSVQHIISDVEALYHHQRPPLLRNFAAFIREIQSVNKEAETRQFWKDQLEDTETCAFPVQPISHAVRATATLSRKIAFSRRANCEVTAANQARAAWALVLSQYSGLENVTFGVTTSGRSLPIKDIDLVRGPTIATVPVRVAVARGTNLEDFLSKVQEQAVAMIPFEQFGLQNIRELSPSARLACDVRSLLLLQFPEDSKPGHDDGRLMRSTSSQMEDVFTYPLNVECVFHENVIVATAKYDDELISKSQVERALASFDAALQSITQQDNSVLLDDLEQISSMDLEQILHWNGDEPTPVAIPIHEIIMNQARSQPSAPAVSACDGDLSYGQLMIYSISLADMLQKECIGKGDIVPICFEKSVWTQVAILAVLLTGACFVLLDPKLPSARLAAIVKDVNAKLILCQPETRNVVSKNSARSFVVSPEVFLSHGGQSDEAWFELLQLLKPSAVLAEDPAYIVFTSGSTGRPKGIVVDHIALSSSAMAHGRAIQIDSHARVLQFAAYTFDVSVGDILVTLALGGCVCVPSEAQRLNDLGEAMRDLGVNHACITSTVAMQLDPQTVPMLRRLVIGGEPMNQALIDRWARNVDLINIYGPAECTVWCVAKLSLTSVDSASDIGHGLGALTWITAIDHPDKLAPIGAIGELVLEGPTLARGYFKDPAKTAESFIIDPLWTRAQKSSGKATTRRMYRTGDLVRYGPDGSIVFVGRRDRQVKLRGQRIELAEIEHHLRRSLPQQKTEAAVELINLQGKTNNPQLVAFVKGSETGGWESSCAVDADPVALESFHEMLSEIDERIASTLPSYMVPTFYMPMRCFPISGSGKLDRRELKAWAENLPASTILALEPKVKEYQAPVGEMESLLGSLWSMILEVEDRIGRDDHFFRLGGDSIRAIKLSAGARRQGLILSVESIFKYPSLASMAVRMENFVDDGSMDLEEQDPAPFSLLKPDTMRLIQEVFAPSNGIPVEEVEDARFCTPLQEGLVSMSLKKQGSYVARVTFDLPSNTDLERLQEVWHQMLQNNPILRSVFVSTKSDGVLQLVIKSQEWLVEKCHSHEVEARAAQFTFALGRSNNLMLLTPASEVRVPTLTWVLHHAAYDGWSLQQYLIEVNNRYYGNSLAPVRSFGTFIKHLQKMDSHAAQTFWAQYLRGAQLCDFPPAPVAECKAIKATVRIKRNFEIPRRVTSDITVATLIRAAWAVVIGRFTGLKDVVFASTMSGRNVGLKGIESVRGPTIATIPVRVRLDPNVTVAGFLHKVQEEAIKVMPYEHYGLQNIQRVSEDAQHACEARSLLVVQPEEYSQSHQTLDLFKGDSCQQDVYSYPLTIECILSAGGTIDLVATYNDTFCEEDSISRLLQYLEETILLLYESPRSPMSWNSLFGPHGNDVATLERWNSRVPPASRSTVHALFKQSVLNAPNKVALSTSGRHLTYEEVDKLSTSFAENLRINGIGRGSLVGLCFDKGWCAVVAMLSVLKVGGAFFALDPTHPPERMREIVNQMHSAVLVTDKANMHKAELFHSCVICIEDALAPDTHQQKLPSFDCKEVQPSDLAFVLFTSGSTGRPKGIEITHGAFCSSILAHAPRLGLTSASRVLQFSAYTYDVSMAEIFTTLAVGGSVCIPSAEDRLNNLSAFMTDQKVSWSFQTPTMASFLQPSALPTLKTLVLGGEGATEHNLQTWSGRVQLINSYGPAECSIWTNCAAGISESADRRNVGLPVGCSIYITDPQDPQFLLPIGAVGELLVGGPNIARGYWKESEKTASSFLSNLRWMRSVGCTGTVYRTGDLGRYCSDGTIEVHGRKDRQVKLRGQRIELPEVEFRLRQCLPPDADVAVDVIRSESAGPSAQLTAFIVLPDIAEGLSVIPNTNILTNEEVIQKLNSLVDALDMRLPELLPPYMVPSLYIPITTLPLSASAKLDRNALQTWAKNIPRTYLSNLMSSGLNDGQPQDCWELQLQELWADILRVPTSDIRRGDHFFRLGGDSIKAMQLVSAGSRRNLHLTVELTFKHPILCNMAVKIREHQSDGTIHPGPAALAPFSLHDSTHDISQLKADAATQCGLTVDALEDLYPCTALQEGLLALSLRQPRSYVGQFTLSLSDDVDLEMLEKAWVDVVNRTPIMRTRFVTTNEGSFMQAVIKDERVVRRISAEDEDSVLRNFQVGRGEKPFSQVNLCRKSVVWIAHHAVYDGLTIHNILSDVEATYRGKKNHASSVPFSLFVQLSTMSNSEDAQKYWRETLDGAQKCEFPALPTSDYQPRPTALMEQQIHFSRTICTEVTSSNLFRAAWALTIAQFLGDHDVVFGLTVSGRNLPLQGIESVRGPTIATVPARIHVQDEWTTEKFLQRVQDSATAMIPFEHLGLQNIQRLSESAQFACDIQSLLILQFPDPDLQASDENGRPIMSQVSGTSLDGFYTNSLNIECVIHQSGANVTVSYDETVIPTTQLRRVLTYFDEAIQHLSSGSPLSKVAELKRLSPVDQEQIHRWNNRSLEYADVCIHELIHKQARLRPNAPAICAWDGDIQYEELMSLSLQLAEHLQQTYGIGPGDFVPVCFEKSKWTQVAILGILCAGAAFVPLDPRNANSRRDAIIQDIAAKIVLCSEGLQEALSSSKVQSLAINDQLLHVMRKQNFDVKDLIPIPSAKSPAYIVFTSGSTGVPKGIVVEHSAVSSSALAHGRAIKISKDSRVLQFAAYTFDVSIGDMLVTLALGGCVCVPSESERINDLPGAIQRMRVNHACLTSTVALQVDPKEVPTLRRLVVGGEPMDQVLVDRWVDQVELVNIYGPAECTIWCTGNELSRGDSAQKIGWGMGAIPWIVDPRDPYKLVPIGAVGELVLHGPTLARCYFNEPEKTKTTFLHNPPWLPSVLSQQSQRVYCTGDLVRYGEDGALYFIGRKDRQVKLRGYRIELAEVEVSLRQLLPPDTEVVVEIVTPGGPSAASSLAAFIRSTSSQGNNGVPEAPRVLTSTLEKQALQQLVESIQPRLSGLLPPYMLPSIYIPVSALPLSMSAKLDRRILQKWADSLSPSFLGNNSADPAKDRRSPEGEIERSLSSFWQTILKLADSPGRDDHFFRLGGDSIRAMQLVSTARRQRIFLSVDKIFQNPILLQMAAAVDQNASMLEEAVSNVPCSLMPFELLGLSSQEEDMLKQEVVSQCRITLDNIDDMYPCTSLQEGLVALSVKEPGAYTARLSFPLSAELDIGMLRQAWENVVNKLPALRTVLFYTKSRGLIQVVLKKFFAWSDDAPETGEAIFVDQFTNQALVKPLCIFTINDKVLTWTVHHALYDAFSLNLIFRLLDWEYSQPSLDPPPFARCEYRRYIADVCKRDNSQAKVFWEVYLFDTPDPAFPHPHNSAYRPQARKTIRTEMPTDLRSTTTTVANLLRAAWALTVGTYANLDQVVFGTTLHGRDPTSPYVTQAVGPTILTVPVRVALNNQQSLGELLQEIHNDSANVAMHAHLGLQEISKLSADSRRACDFQHMFLVNDASTEQGTSKVLGAPLVADNNENFQMYALEVECQVHASSVQARMFYDSEVINDTRAEWMLEHFNSVYRAICSAPASTKISALHHATASEHCDILAANTHVPAEVPSTIHELFGDKANQHPTKTAVCAWDGIFKYSDVDNLSDQLAQLLIDKGVSSGSHVVLCFEKSKWACIAMLAVLKAGAVCVPLNDTYPLERAHYVVSHVKALVCLSSPRCAKIFDDCPVDVILVNHTMIDGHVLDPPRLPTVTPDDAAFVMFTSGTTGYPKGVIQTHSNLVTSTLAIGTRMGYTANSRILQFASFTFDVSLGDIFGAFFFGACICIPSEQQRLDSLDEFIREMEVDQACLTPAVARTLAGKDLPTLGTLSLGGEPLQLTDIRQWAGKVHLRNIYGVTECTIWCAISDPIDPSSSSPRNFGYGMGARLWIVDPADTDCLMPPGAIGELLIEGPIVGKGYLHDEAKTKTSFISNPHWHPSVQHGGMVKLYRTGDLVRQENASSYEYLCRKDTQIKINGQRVELGEIENQLQLAIPPHLLTVVDQLPIFDSSVLVAFIAPRDPAMATPLLEEEVRVFVSKVRSSLFSVLPSHMIPAKYVFVENMPLSASGKVNRRALREQGEAVIVDAASEGEQTAEDLSEQELQLSELWKSSIRLEGCHLGPADNFFAVGGDSLAAMRLVSGARQAGLDLSVQTIFAHPTLADMATQAAVTRQSKPQAESSYQRFELVKDPDLTSIKRTMMAACGIESQEILDILPTSPLQHDYMVAAEESPGWFCTQFVVQLRPSVQLNKLLHAWEVLFESNEIFRTRIVRDGMRYLQVVHRARFAAAIHSWDLAAYLESDQRCPFIAGGEMQRMAVIQDQNEVPTHLVWSAHHAIYDGWSIRLILRRLSQLYGATDSISSTIIEPLGKYIKHISRINGPSAHDFWISQLSGTRCQPLRQSPASGKEPCANAFYEHQLITPTLLPDRSGTNITLPTILYTAMGLLVARRSQSPDAVLSLTLTGRNEAIAGIEEVIAPMITMVPLRIHVDPATTLAALLRDVQVRLQAMIPWEHTGWSNIARIGPECGAACANAFPLVVQAFQDDDGATDRSSHFAADQMRAVPMGAPPLPILSECRVQGTAVIISFRYDPSLFDRSFIADMCVEFESLVMGLSCADAKKCIGEL